MNTDKIIKKLKGNLEKWKPIPFWSWNGRLEQGRLNSQIDKMKSYNMGGYFMHARSGLETEYFSEEWLNAAKGCTEYGEKLGMTSWLYDENGYPSGFAGGKLLENPEFHDQYLTYSIGSYDEEANLHYLVGENSLTLTDNSVADGEYLNLFIHNSIGTADVLNSEVTDKFLELTHQSYKDYFGEDFSKKISGVFTDEPQYYCFATAYTRVMEKYFYEKYGENLFDGLGLLFVKKDGWRSFRYRYWKAMQELLVKNFGQRVYNWCENNGVKLTGHYVEESSLGFQMKFCGGVMPLYEYMHIPGIDWLGTATENELSPRQIASVAAQLGKKQILTESFACCGWQVKPKSLKRIAEFQFLNGVSLLCHHLVPYSEYGIRKHDHPAHYSSVNPWIDCEFANFNEYFTRLGCLISESEEQVNVAVLHPIRSAYFDYDASDYGDYGHLMGLDKQDKQFRSDLRSISSKGIAYHFLDETLLAKYGFVKNAKIGCGQREYDFLILPHITAMDSTTEKLLKEYALSGGKILVLGDNPEFLEGEPFDFSYISTNCSFEDIINTQAYKLSDYNTEIYSTFRSIDGQDFIFLQNASTKNTYTQVLDFGGRAASLERLNLETLEAEPVPLSITLAPEESALLFLSDCEPQTQSKLKQFDLKLDNAKVSFGDNNLTVDMASYSVDGVNYSNKYPCESLMIKLGKEKYKGEIFFKYEFDVRAIPQRIFLRAEQGRALNYWFNGEEVSLKKTEVSGEILYESDISALVKMGVNEYVVKLDWYQLEKASYILEGDNICGSLGNMLTYDSEISPIYIGGAFGVYFDNYKEVENGYIQVERFYIGEPPSNVTEPVLDGLPFFSGKLTLTQKVLLDSKEVALSLKGTQLLSYVKVNGKYAGKLMFNDLLDISDYAKIGENELEVDLILSNRNHFGPFHFNGITHFGVGPDCWDMRVGKWENGKNSYIRENYELLKLF